MAGVGGFSLNRSGYECFLDGGIGMSKNRSYGVGLCFGLAVLAWVLGSYFPLIGGPVFGILIGIGIASSFGGTAGSF